MAISGFENQFSVAGKEYGFIAEDTPIDSKIIPAIIPKITGALSSSNKSVTVNFNQIISNAPACRPTFSTTINFLQHIPVSVEPGSNITSYASDGILKKDTRIIVKFINGNINSAYV